MRGPDRQQFQMISYVSLEKRVPAEHPLRTLWALSDAVLRDLSPLFDQLYARTGRPSIAPEKLLRAILLQVLYSIRSEALLMEQLDYNLLFRWFVGLDVDDPVWDATVFSKNRERLLAGEVATAFFVRVRALAEEHGLLSDEHFTVDGTVVQAWAGQKSFQRRDRDTPPPSDPAGGGVNFRGETRSNATHASSTDPQARLYRKSHNAEAKLCYLGHVLMENRHGLVVEAEVTEATGTGERDAGAAGGGEQRWAPTKRTTPAGSSPRCVPRAASRMWRRIRGAAAVRSIAARPAMSGAASASTSAIASNRSSAG